MKNLLDQTALENSPVVANSLMNRERVLRGGNSYEKELSFGICDFLQARCEIESKVVWLDLCCGRGNALIEAAEFFSAKNLRAKIEITGIDLAGLFAPAAVEFDFLKLIESSFENWRAPGDFDLITCVHGLHYVGDKLGFIRKAVAALKPDGVFLVNFDPSNLKFEGETPAGTAILKNLRQQGFDYAPKKHLLICRGKKDIKLNCKYIGADDRAGANYTQQKVVNSYYQHTFRA